ncbi:MAG: SDR family NAD(P)-dependent oxidoreductase [Roseibium sp.]|uniref:SDR family NAD(P)-dependent oxidoreductase n=1 Tax=Roseibium sp. TaxID=1936156 RepID=UPI00262B4D71|nr:SDR family NAD(P)-dependent oxidoreductase [Roseibium sp.]MCV0426421.1 SDR family NAD(P)-dependent oxidoreductase [Roseibium sp.]
MSKSVAVIIGASGGIGSAVLECVRTSGKFDEVIPLGRTTLPGLDLLSEQTIRYCAGWLGSREGDLRLLFDATGALSVGEQRPEKSWREVDPELLARAYAINAIGPALLMKYFLPLLPKSGRSVFATLSARVGSIGDNRTGGWYAYRASKAALNQIARTASVELARRKPEAILVALHPGTVQTSLSDGFQKNGLKVQRPEEAAIRLLTVLENLEPGHSGCFLDHLGKPVAW